MSDGTVDGVYALALVVYYVLFSFWLLLTARVVVELVRTFARQWRPAGGVAVALETVYTVTDPPVRLLRRLIPTVRIGGVGLDLSIIVLLLVVIILMRVADPR
ncbi:YggT family protein [Saccharothrix variisporea]|uniref:YggT family protein n=1 Tax=Saccharothrix variisporea TaxID=543527 RepID=A0A495XLA1_9PSEU|nr:YggT family protein [Saccharothrix variisporea]